MPSLVQTDLLTNVLLKEGESEISVYILGFKSKPQVKYLVRDMKKTCEIRMLLSFKVFP